MRTQETSELGFKSASERADLVADKSISSVELTRYFIDRIEQYDTLLNAVVVRDFDQALAAAENADALLANGKQIGAFHGLPMTVKESFDVQGLTTTWGNPQSKTNLATADAIAVDRLKKTGAILLGKTNVPLNIGDFQSYNEIYGQTNNPWDLARTPGGSSGGAASAVAAGLTSMELGSDLGGSVRNPAHFCGVFSHKPTWGVIPFRSQSYPGAASVPQELDMAVPGPVARDAKDLEIAVRHLAGADSLTSMAWKLTLPPPRKSSLRGLRVAIWPEESLAPVAAEISDRITSLGNNLSCAGAIVSDSARPDFDIPEVWNTYRSLVMALSGGPGFGIDYQKWLELNLKRGEIRQQWQSFFNDWDILLCPITSTTAFAHDHTALMDRVLTVNNEDRSYWEHVFWAGLASLAYLPSTVFPTGLSTAGLPIGLQAMGAEFDDYTTIEFARLVSEAFGGFQAPILFC